MKRPEEDLVNRTIVWDAMHLLWLDTDVDEFHFDDVAKICAGTDYTLNELEKIYWAEVYPCMRYNLIPWDVAGEWLAQDSKSLSEAILQRHKFGKRTWFKRKRSYAHSYWEKLSSAIIQNRNRAA